MNTTPLMSEERLKQALVPIEEQPYEVPENWCWTRLGNITEVIGGGTPSSSVTEYYENGTVPWLSPSDLSGYNELYISRGAKNITELGLSKSSARMLPTNTVCLSTRAPIGYVVIAQNPLCTNQGFKSFVPSPCYLPQYLYWYLKGNKAMLESYASGTTFLELSGSKAALVEFPIAPLAEQKRIVDTIADLFADLDKAAENAQTIIDNAESRRSSILHQAFTGELTKQWRVENGVLESLWTGALLKDIVSGFKYGSSEKSDYNNNGTPVLRIPNIGDGEIDFADLKYFVGEDCGEYQVHKDDILIIRSNGSRDLVGKCALVPELDRKYAYASFLIRIQVSDSLIPKFLVYYINSSDAREQLFKKAKSSAGIHNINSNELGSITISLPAIEEQLEIVRILDELLADEQRIKEAAEEMLDKIAMMKKSMLADAFRGKLGTNDPSDQPATELLKQILT